MMPDVDAARVRADDTEDLHEHLA
jgi:hypothetical protein